MRTQKFYMELFGFVKDSGYFPPLNFLNEFLLKGCDPCDQDGRMDKWNPFLLNEEEYSQIVLWWKSIDSNFLVHSLNSDNWDDWVSKILDDKD